MYIKRVEITNIRSIHSLVMEFPDNAVGWHVILGDNGSGKSTLLQSIALVLVGIRGAYALHQSPDHWLTASQLTGHSTLTILPDPSLDSTNLQVASSTNLEATIGMLGGYFQETTTTDPQKNGNNHIWGLMSGWFSASYGPFRRFTGGDPTFSSVDVYPKFAAHKSVFGEQIALPEGLEWLKTLRIKKQFDEPVDKLLEAIKQFVNQDGFLPHNVKLDEISYNDIFFIDSNRNRLSIEQFSDGYRSILSLTFDLIRQMYRVYHESIDNLFADDDFTKIIAPGVVMIDEVDAHLHPSWQRKIGIWLCKHFPKIQFIVTTHSPLICQAAIKGTIWRLPRPGTDDVLIKAEGEELNRLLYGNILDAYGTEFFGRDIGRSEVAQDKLQQLADLNIKELEHGLTADEKHEQNELRNMMPTDTAITPNK